jgi:pyruvate dehydrogenase E2 component (dihydrolipoamide acetyltransferase)
VVIRMMTPLGLSYDHRVIDGAEAARFIVDLVAALENLKEASVKL